MNRGWGSAGRVAVVVAVLLAATAPVAGVGGRLDASRGPAAPSDSSARSDPAAPSDSPARSVPADRAPAALAQESPENNSTVSHRNPDEVADESAPGAVEEWLAREVSGGSGGVDLSDEDRERARELVESDPELADLAARYSDGDGAGDQQADRSEVLGAAQRQFFADVQRYRDARGEYERVREGNGTDGEANRTDRERRLAHRLERHAAAVNRSARQLNESYAELGSAERDERENVTRTVGRVRANVTASQTTVRDRTLVRTRLSVAANDSSGSFADPVTLAGRLRTADGAPLADENVTLVVGGQIRNVATDGEGRFEFDYRPTFDAAGERARTVWFLPANDSAYLRASDAATFAVERVGPNVTVTNYTESVRYDEPLAVEGTVEAGGEGVPNVPVAVTVDGVPVDTVATGPNGSFDAAAALPANVSTGDRQVDVRLALDDPNLTAGANGSGTIGANSTDGASGASRIGGTVGANRIGGTPGANWLTDGTDSPTNGTDSPDGPPALAPANATASVTVESTATDLSITRVEPLEASAFVTGRLVAGDGAPLANRTVALRVDDAAVGNVTTNDTGGFAATVGLPSNETDESPVRVTAEFSSPGNLEPARANATVARSSSGSDLPVDPLELGVAGLLSLAAVGVAVWRFRSGGASSPGLDGRDGGPQGGRGAGGPRWGSPEVFLDAAAGALDDGAYDAAAGAAYASVRRRLAAGEGGVERPAGARTHWEFYADCRAADLPDDRLDRLEHLTATYEQAAFAPDAVSPDDAAEAVDIARSLE